MPKLPNRLRALPARVGAPFVAASRRASGTGVSLFAQQVVTGFVTSELKKLRRDQLWTLLANGDFLADVIDEDNLPARWEGLIALMGRFMDVRTIPDKLDALITPELMMEAVKRARPDALEVIINNAGPKWFWDQTFYMKDKIRRIIEAKT